MRKLIKWLQKIGLVEIDWIPDAKCIGTGICQETEGFKGTEHEGVDVCEDGCVWGGWYFRVKYLMGKNHWIKMPRSKPSKVKKKK